MQHERRKEVIIFIRRESIELGKFVSWLIRVCYFLLLEGDFMLDFKGGINRISRDNH